MEFCADFWQTFLKALDTEPVRNYIKINGLIIENCRRKNGFVGMLIISCRVGDKIQLVSVDISPCIASDTLDGYTALLRPRVYDNKVVGEEFCQGLELSSSQKDWEFLKYLQAEVMCGYALVKILRSMAGPFQTERGRMYTAEDILPSYMVKTSLLWILDPEKQFFKIYKDLELDSVVESEDSSDWQADVGSLCQDILQGPYVSADKADVASFHVDIWEDSHVSGLGFLDRHDVLGIYEACTAGYNVNAKDKILHYTVATKCSCKREQNGINLELMEENWEPDISHQYEIIYSRKAYTDTEGERARIQHINENKRKGHLSHHRISYPDISEETARKCRVWALRMVRLLPLLLNYDGHTDEWWTGTKEKIVGLRNYYLPHQEIQAKDKALVVALCKVLEAVLE